MTRFFGLGSIAILRSDRIHCHDRVGVEAGPVAVAALAGPGRELGGSSRLPRRSREARASRW